MFFFHEPFLSFRIHPVTDFQDPFLVPKMRIFTETLSLFHPFIFILKTLSHFHIEDSFTHLLVLAKRRLGSYMCLSGWLSFCTPNFLKLDFLVFDFSMVM